MLYTVDRENSIVEIISRLRPTVNVRSTTTPDNHSVTTSDSWLSWYLVVYRLNARNAPGTRPLCNRQFINMKFFYTNYFYVQISRSNLYPLSSNTPQKKMNVNWSINVIIKLFCTAELERWHKCDEIALLTSKSVNKHTCQSVFLVFRYIQLLAYTLICYM